MIASAIVVSATLLRWVIAADLAAVRAAIAEAVLGPAAVVVHPAWEVSAAVGEAVMAVVVCAEAAVSAVVAAVCAVAEAVGKTS